MTRPADVTLVPLNEDPGVELSLVSTQALRKVLGQEAAEGRGEIEEVARYQQRLRSVQQRLKPGLRILAFNGVA